MCLVFSNLSAQKFVKYVNGQIELKSNEVIEGAIQTFVEERIDGKIYYKTGDEEAFVLVKDIVSLTFEDGISYKTLEIDEDVILVKKNARGGS